MKLKLQIKKHDGQFPWHVYLNERLCAMFKFKKEATEFISDYDIARDLATVDLTKGAMRFVPHDRRVM